MLKYLKVLNLLIFAVVLFLISCGQTAENKKESPPAEKTETSIPGVEKLSFSDTIRLSAGEDMRFNSELFRVRAGKKIKLIFTNTGKKNPASMTHNVVVLVKGTDIADFADAVHNAKDEQYVPASVAPLVIAHTKLVSGGDSDEIEFTITGAGVYDYVCSFPGHWGTMQGKIVAE